MTVHVRSPIKTREKLNVVRSPIIHKEKLNGRLSTSSYPPRQQSFTSAFWIKALFLSSCIVLSTVWILTAMMTRGADEWALRMKDTLEKAARQLESDLSLSKEKHPLYSICPWTPFDPQALQQALKASDEFHKLGGSLKSVQRFRDSAIDDTLKKLELNFVPNDDNDSKNQKPITHLRQHLKQHYDKHYDSRGGYGKPLPGHFVRQGQEANGNTDIPSLMANRWIEPIEEATGHSKWDASLGPIGPDCPNLMQLGNKQRDGYKFFCQTTRVSNPKKEPTTSSTTVRDLLDRSAATKLPDTATNECHILSVGGNDNWKFEVAAADTLGCITHTFDCTLPDNKPRHKPERPDLRFYPHCLDGRTYTDPHGRSYVTYQDMLTLAGIDTPPAYLKIDVEGFEYDVFSQMIQHESNIKHNDLFSSYSKTTSLLPQQIQVELHWATRMIGVEWMPRTRSAGEIALFSSMMYQGGGYLPIHLDFNAHCTTCMEVLYYKAVC